MMNRAGELEAELRRVLADDACVAAPDDMLVENAEALLHLAAAADEAAQRIRERLWHAAVNVAGESLQASLAGLD